MRILVTGASGLLGRQIFKTLDRHDGDEVIGTALSRSSTSLRRIDLTDTSKVTALIDELRPDAVIHAAAERRPDRSAADPAVTVRLNVDATKRLSRLCAKFRAYLLYVSTDYVFDGTAPYTTESMPRPLNFYGQTKLEGERYVLEAGGASAVLRVPLLYGPVETLHESVVTGIYADLQSGRNLLVDHWAVRYPTYTPDVAEVCRKLINLHRAERSATGIFHWSGNEAFTKYEMAVEIGALFDLPTDQLVPSLVQPPGEARPKNSHLDCSRLESLFHLERTSFGDGVRSSLGKV